MAVKPISPSDAMEEKHIPDEIIVCFNELIVKNISKQGIAVFALEDVIDLAARFNIDRKTIVTNNWLDVKRHYQKIGWDVRLTYPQSNESFKPFYSFDVKYGNIGGEIND